MHKALTISAFRTKTSFSEIYAKSISLIPGSDNILYFYALSILSKITGIHTLLLRSSSSSSMSSEEFCRSPFNSFINSPLETFLKWVACCSCFIGRIRASLIRVLKSLPEWPSVYSDKKSKSSSLRMWWVPALSFIIFFLVSLSGMGTNIFLSNLLSAAMSSSHGMLVVANTETYSLMFLMLSIYLRNSVLILLSVSLSLPVRFLPKESISSIRMIEGLCSRANSNNIERSFSLSPMNFEVISAKETQKQVALLW